LAIVNTNIFAQNAEYSNENIAVVSDRNLYVAGENIQFSAIVQNPANTSKALGSKILYTELITTEGASISTIKSIISANIAKGSVTIPDGINSGIYYLRSYTRLANNVGNAAFGLIALKIVNCNSSYYNLTESRDSSSIENFTKNDNLKINIESNTIKTNKVLKFTINSDPKTHPYLAVSLVPKSSFTASGIPTKTNNFIRIFYPAETRGPSIMGKVMFADTAESVPNALVHLSITGRNDIQSQYTDADGRFYFSLPNFQGNHDIFLCVSSDAEQKLKILVSNDFASETKKLPTHAFTLSPEEKKLALQLQQNLQIQRQFLQPDTSKITAIKTDTIPFYATPDNVIKIADYIQMPTLREYFNELPSLVNVRKRKGKNRFIVFGTQPDLKVYDPLILVDMVAIDDMEKILSIPPALLDRIETIHTMFQKGNITYGGVISMFSKKQDYSGIDLPNSGIFVDFNFVQNNKELTSMQGEHIPDSRSTLLWQSFQASANESQYNFRTAETPGSYELVVQSINNNGEIEYNKTEIEIIPEEKK
jgi:hypothetical protein